MGEKRNMEQDTLHSWKAWCYGDGSVYINHWINCVGKKCLHIERKYLVSLFAPSKNYFLRDLSVNLKGRSAKPLRGNIRKDLYDLRVGTDF